MTIVLLTHISDSTRKKIKDNVLGIDIDSLRIEDRTNKDLVKFVKENNFSDVKVVEIPDNINNVFIGSCLGTELLYVNNKEYTW